MSNDRDNWEIVARGTEERIIELEKELEDAFLGGWVARDSIEPIKNMKSFGDTGGHEWYAAWKETKH